MLPTLHLTAATLNPMKFFEQGLISFILYGCKAWSRQGSQSSTRKRFMRMAWIAPLWSSLLPLTRTSMKMATTWGMCEILSGRKGKHKMVGKGVQERLQQERREEEHSHMTSWWQGSCCQAPTCLTTRETNGSSPTMYQPYTQSPPFGMASQEGNRQYTEFCHSKSALHNSKWHHMHRI